MNIFQKILFPFSGPKTKFLEGKWWHRLAKTLFVFAITLLFLISGFVFVNTFPEIDDYRVLDSDYIYNSYGISSEDTSLENSGFVIDSMFPGLSQEQVEWIYQNTNNIQNDVERMQKQEDIYREVLPMVKLKARLKYLADAIRKGANIGYDNEDNILIEDFLGLLPNPEERLTSYLDGDDSLIQEILPPMWPEDYSIPFDNIIKYVATILLNLGVFVVSFLLCFFVLQIIYFKGIVYIVYGNKTK